MKKKKYLVEYDGWIIVEAKNEDKAHYEAGTALANGVPSDGEIGEWFITEIQEHEEEDEE